MDIYLPARTYQDKGHQVITPDKQQVLPDFVDIDAVMFGNGMDCCPQCHVRNISSSSSSSSSSRRWRDTTTSVSLDSLPLIFVVDDSFQQSLSYSGSSPPQLPALAGDTGVFLPFSIEPAAILSPKADLPPSAPTTPPTRYTPFAPSTPPQMPPKPYHNLSHTSPERRNRSPVKSYTSPTAHPQSRLTTVFHNSHSVSNSARRSPVRKSCGGSYRNKATLPPQSSPLALSINKSLPPLNENESWLADEETLQGMIPLPLTPTYAGVRNDEDDELVGDIAYYFESMNIDMGTLSSETGTLELAHDAARQENMTPTQVELKQRRHGIIQGMSTYSDSDLLVSNSAVFLPYSTTPLDMRSRPASFPTTRENRRSVASAGSPSLGMTRLSWSPSKIVDRKVRPNSKGVGLRRFFKSLSSIV